MVAATAAASEMQELRDYLGSLFIESSGIEGLKLLSLSREYVIQTLVAFLRSDSFFNDDPGTPALAWLYKRAMELNGVQQRNALRQLGDTALFVSGFFNDHVERSPVGTGYYIDMGGAAYQRLSAMARSEVFWELSQKFPSIVEVLIHMAGQTSLGSNQGLDRLYERYGRNPNSKLLLDALLRQYAVPVFSIGDS